MEAVLNAVKSAMKWVVALLPDSPFQKMDITPVKDVLGYVAYFVDMPFIINALNIWLAAITIYYVYMAILRWVKALS